MVAVTVATVAARETLGAAQQVRFFRALGRRYGTVSSGALLVFVLTGLALAGDPADWSTTQATIAVLTVLTAALTVVGVINARAVQRLRARALADPSDAPLASRLRTAARTAAALRAAIAVVTLAAVLTASTLI
jgi:hypothetical protein